MTQYKVITALEAEQLIHNENPVILDCRDTTHYRANHIENAMHLHEKLRDSLLKITVMPVNMLPRCLVISVLSMFTVYVVAMRVGRNLQPLR
jgi:rhodanese-related sulfurtransferase